MIKIKTLRYLLIISCLLLICTSVGFAVNWDGELTTEFNYNRIEDDLPPTAKSSLELDNNTMLQLDVSGLFHNLQYDLELEGEGKDYSGQINRAVITTTVGPTTWELGHRAWSWGQGFSFSPTYPFAENTAYTGLETNVMFNNYNLTWGAALDNKQEELKSSWLRLNSLLATSDFTIVASYLNNSSKLSVSPKKQQESGLNLGLNYSKDFLNGLEIHSGMNLRKWNNQNKVKKQYLIGSQYNTTNQKILLVEYYQKVDDYLTLVFRNQSTITTDWHWELREVLNINDYGELRSFDLSYTGLDNLTPQLEINSFAGPKASQIKEKPMDWTINFKLTTALF